jgi:hypothetical protein
VEEWSIVKARSEKTRGNVTIVAGYKKKGRENSSA